MPPRLLRRPSTSNAGRASRRSEDHVEIGQIFDSVERKRIRNIDLFQIRMQVTALGYKSIRQLAGVTVEGREPDRTAGPLTGSGLVSRRRRFAHIILQRLQRMGVFAELAKIGAM